MELIIKTNSIGGITDDQFFRFCQENNSISFERNSKGEIIIVAPKGSETGRINNSISGELYLWNKQNKLGVTFDSNAGFTLPDNSVRSPDAAYVACIGGRCFRRRIAQGSPTFVLILLSRLCQRMTMRQM